MTALFDPLRLAEVAWDVACVNTATPEQIAHRQQTRLAALFEAARAAPMYRALLQGHDAGEVTLASMPVVHKKQLMHRFDHWVSDPVLRLSPLRAFAADPQQIAMPFLGQYQVWESSGTSGTPAVFVQDARAMAVYDALEALRRARPRTLYGWPDPTLLGQRVAFVGATGGHFASFVSMQRLRQINPWLAPAMQSFSIAQPIDALVAQLNEFAPSVIATYPTAASMLAGRARRNVTLLPLALSTVMEDQAGVFDFQLRQHDAHTLVLRLGLRGKAAVTAAAQCHAALHAFCKEQGVGKLRLVNELDVALVHGRSGKLQRVIAMPDLRD